ncbi:MAG TPA: hypothetical protein VN512_03545 [Clostridia bacterium]|nr:hypothetical protein [Clostridia bacterium]
MQNDDYVFIFGRNVSLSGGFTGTLTVSLPVGEKYNGQTVTILHAKQNGTIETYTAVVADGKATFTVTSLSPLAVFISSAALVQVPNTGDYSSPWRWLMCAAAMAAMDAALISGKRKKAYKKLYPFKTYGKCSGLPR